MAALFINMVGPTRYSRLPTFHTVYDFLRFFVWITIFLPIFHFTMLSGLRPLSQVGSAIDNDNLRHPASRAARSTRSNAGHVTREGRVNGSRLFCSIFYFEKKKFTQINYFTGSG